MRKQKPNWEIIIGAALATWEVEKLDSWYEEQANDTERRHMELVGKIQTQQDIIKKLRSCRDR